MPSISLIILPGIAILVILTFTLNKRQNSTFRDNVLRSKSEIAASIIPDAPVPFGHKCVWFAVKTDQKNRLVEIFKLRKVMDCNWEAGIAQAYKGSVFITPAIAGWTLVCGWGLPTGDSKESIRKLKDLLRPLSEEFSEDQFFCTHRVSEYHCWMKASNGNIDRVYSYSGEAGENPVVEGQPTEFEKGFDLINTLSVEAQDPKYFEREDLDFPNEETVMQVAGNWSVDPTKLDERNDIASGLGLLAQ